MDSIFFDQRKDLGLNFVKFVTDDLLTNDNYEHYQNLIEDTNILLDPFVVAHYHQSDRKTSQPLDQLLLGYIKDEKQPKSIEVCSDREGTIYLPNIGYLLTNFPYRTFSLNISSHSSDNRFNLTMKGKNIPFEFEELSYIPDTKIEIFKHGHEYLFHKLEKDEDNTHPYLESEDAETIDSFSETILKAFDTIRKIDPIQYKELKELVKKIVFFRSERCANFTSVEFHGTIFISTYKSTKKLTFLDILVKECGHLALSSILFNINACFTIDPHEPKFKCPGKTRLRGIYESLQNVYSLAKRVRFFNICYSSGIFSGVQEYELLDLLISNIKSLSKGLTYINDRSLYTKEGWAVFEEVKNLFVSVYKERKNIIERHRPPIGSRNSATDHRVFDNNDFLQINKLPRRAVAQFVANSLPN